MSKQEEQAMLCDLARFRYALRRFVRFSEKEARSAGVTPQQHQLMLGIAGFTENGIATISQLAEFLQERNNSVVGLVGRAVESGLVQRQNSSTDRRQVLVSLTPRGQEVLLRLSRVHHQEVERVRTMIDSSASALEPRKLETRKSAMSRPVDRKLRDVHPSGASQPAGSLQSQRKAS